MSVAVAFEKSTGVGIDDEDRVPAGVEKDGVGGFRADAVEVEEPIAKDRSWRGEHLGERSVVELVEEVHKGFERFGFLAEVAGRAEERCKFRAGHSPDGNWGKQASATQVSNGAFDVGPGSVLREDSADDDFEASAAGPPVLRAIGGEKCIEVRRQRRRRERVDRKRNTRSRTSKRKNCPVSQ